MTMPSPRALGAGHFACSSSVEPRAEARGCSLSTVLCYNRIMKFSRQTHAVFYTRYHLVFGTRYRRKVLKSGMGAFMSVIMSTIHRRHPEIEIYEVNADQDHIHLLVSIAPKMSVSEAVRILKCNTARMMCRKFPFLKKTYWNNQEGIWSVGYFVSTVGVNEKMIQKYIELQGQEDSGQAQLELE